MHRSCKGWSEIAHIQILKALFFKYDRDDSSVRRMVVYYDSDVISVVVYDNNCANKQLFRTECDNDTLEAVFHNPSAYKKLGFRELNDIPCMPMKPVTLETVKECTGKVNAEVGTLKKHLSNVEDDLRGICAYKQTVEKRIRALEEDKLLLNKTNDLLNVRDKKDKKKGANNDKNNSNANDNKSKDNNSGDKKGGNKNDKTKNDGCKNDGCKTKYSNVKNSGRNDKGSNSKNNNNEQNSCKRNDKIKESSNKNRNSSDKNDSERLMVINCSSLLTNHLKNMKASKIHQLAMGYDDDGLVYTMSNSDYKMIGKVPCSIKTALERIKDNNRVVTRIKTGSIGRFFIRCGDDGVTWKDNNEIEETVDNEVRSVVYGDGSETYVVLYNDGDILWNNITKELCELLKKAKNAKKSRQIEDISMGPNDEFFIRYYDGSIEYGNCPAFIIKAINAVPGRIREVIFGHDDSVIVRHTID